MAWPAQPYKRVVMVREKTSDPYGRNNRSEYSGPAKDVRQLSTVRRTVAVTAHLS